MVSSVYLALHLLYVCTPVRGFFVGRSYAVTPWARVLCVWSNSASSNRLAETVRWGLR